MFPVFNMLAGMEITEIAVRYRFLIELISLLGKTTDTLDIECNVKQQEKHDFDALQVCYYC